MVWLAEDDPLPEVLKTGFRSRKRMFTIFFNTHGPVVVDIMPDKATITATYYTTSVLPKVLLHNQSTARTRRRSRIQLHHDNAAPHIALNTQTYLDDNGIRLMENPLYSPDLARAISDSFQKLNQPVQGSLFLRILACSRRSDRGNSAKRYVSKKKKQQQQRGSWVQGSKTLLKLCIQRWGPYLLQKTENAFRSGG